MIKAADIGIDLGTTNIVVYIKGKGIIIKEPAVIAYDRDEEKIKACGAEAASMIGRTPGNVSAIMPLRDGVISDYVMTEYLLRYFIRKAIGHRGFLKPRIVIAVPARTTDVERRAVKEAAYQAGAKDVYTVESAAAAAVGAGLDISKAAGNMVVDIGGGTTDIAVISLGDTVASASIPIGGNAFTEAIIRFVRKNHLIFIGEQTAENVKKSIGYAWPHKEEKFMEIKGRNVFSGLPGKVMLSSFELVEPLQETGNRLADAVANVIEQTTPEIATDIQKRGIVLTGGGTLLRGVEEAITRRTGIFAVTAENPASCTALGTARYLQVIDE
ncbi:MAG: rod shape-determining protein [Lachnospiraceae bacterium]|nr:rod shape-determining protein [Lachnospiraceae bacterium]